MNHDFWEPFWKQLRELYKREKVSTEVYEAEQPILRNVLQIIANRDDIKDIYEFDEPIGIGGAGLVLRLKDKRLGLYRALKIPRPKEENLISVKSEIEQLREIRHENIIGLYTLGEVEIPNFNLPYPYFLMDYIRDAQDIRKRANAALDRANASKDLSDIMRWIATTFFKIAKATTFLHQQGIIHFDIKPSNILIAADDRPVLSDLGFAKKKSEDEKPTGVGFTLYYAHPDLSTDYRHKSTKNKVKKEIAPKDFKYAWDIYAFGKSLLEIIALTDQRFPDAVAYDYTFVYLHLAASRMLDGRNLYQRDTDRIRNNQIQSGEGVSVYKETWQELDAPDFEQIKYSAFKDICTDFEKLLGGKNLLDSISELNVSYPKICQTSRGTPAPFTKRVKYVVEHPVFSRLAHVPQLGPISTVYPTATHTRLEHSLGTFRNCCLYVQSLYNDPHNPLFRQLVTDHSIKAVLLASLLHDLGHYPLAHEIEGVAQQLKHEHFTLKFLDNTSKARFGNTLQDIIRNEDWGWGIELGEIKQLLPKAREEQMSFFGKKSLKVQMLSSIIDGPVDVDKLDYFLRDSQNCYLTYGELIDVDRLVRTLTTIILKSASGEKALTVGTYEKGQSAAESLTFARYLLYQSVYWHHTARAATTMLRHAIRPALRTTKGTGKQKTSFYEAFDKLLGVSNEARNITTDAVLELVREWTDDQGRELIDMMKCRNYYKRVLTIHSYPAPEQGRNSFLARFRDSYRTKPDFEKDLQKRVQEAFSDYLRHTQAPRVSLLAPDKTNKTIELLDQPRTIICDCPEPIYGTSGAEKDKLRFIPEPERLQKNYFVRADAGERVSQVWIEVHFRLMDIASKGRVFCHPEIRDTLMAALGPDGIEDCLDLEIK